jgi:hypothetical protein
MRTVLVLGLVSVFPLLAAQAEAQAQTEVRLVPYTGPYAYGLQIAPPWQDGGSLIINLPEHLEVWPSTWGILRYSDKPPTGGWQVSEDGKTALLNAESLPLPATVPNVSVKGAAKVVGTDRVEITLRIENKSDKELPGIRPLYCSQYRTLTGFPQWQEDFKHTYVLIASKPVALADIPTEKPDADVKAAYVRGATQRDSNDFARSRGGLIEDKELDAAIIAVESLDGARRVLIAWTPGKSMLSNAAIPCAHGDPYYGPIPVGAAREAKGVIWFTEKPIAEAMTTLFKEGHGLAPVTR